MNMLKKALLLVCMMALVVCISVGATIAYLTSQDTVTNTFTVGKVGIELWETDVDTEGKPIPSASPVKENEYHLLPGQTYVKDPTVTVKAESDEAYIRMMVTVDNVANLKSAFPKAENSEFYYENTDYFMLQNLVEGWDKAIWPCYGITEKDGKAVYEFRYYQTVTNADETDMTLPSLFTAIKIPGEIVNERLADLQGAKITVVAHAIQAAGFETADLAWAQFIEK